MKKILRAIGLMSGTSMDGIDLALIESDGVEQIINQDFLYQPYKSEFKSKLQKITYCASNNSLVDPWKIKEIENELTILHADLINNFLSKKHLSAKDIDIIGFHGHTIFHNPHKLITWQIGNGHLLASRTGINVIADFRSRDVVDGGHGAPLVPIYQFCLLKNQFLPAAILNIGGISNITYCYDQNEENIEAFDVGFGNSISDDLIKKKIGLDFDADGEIAAKGKINFNLAKEILTADIFNYPPPKSFHRQDFISFLKKLEELEISDALKTAAYIHAHIIALNLKFLSSKPKEIFICGGGRKNPVIIEELRQALAENEIKVRLVEEIGFDGDAIESQAFGFLAIRVLKGLPISFQKTTGVLRGNNYALASALKNSSSCGGAFYRA
jgi:anhydro-N-acetylmuramic acid kinase